MSLYVRIVNNQVSDCWDTPPAEGVGNNGWMNAVENRPSIVANRQGYTAHTFDLTTNPVGINYGTFNIAVADRASGMTANANFAVSQLLQQMSRDPSTFDATKVAAAQTASANTVAMIAAATTHNQLDAIQNGTATTVAQVQAITDPDPVLTVVTV
jgi:hypothetical protein